MTDKGKIDFGNNYGDVALDLPPDWSRSRLAGDPNYMLTAVGHENGVPDAYRTDRPKDRHQFVWLEPKDVARLSLMRTKHYEPVTKKDWTKNPHLWDWNGEGLVEFNGQILYARDECYYVEDAERLKEAKRQRDRKTQRDDEQYEQRIRNRGGDIISDDRGRPLVPLSRSDRDAF